MPNSIIRKNLQHVRKIGGDDAMTIDNRFTDRAALGFDRFESRYRPIWWEEYCGFQTSQSLRRLQGLVTRNELPPVIALIGPSGTGKTSLGRTLQAWAFCQQPVSPDRGCGSCNACRSIRTIPACFRPGQWSVEFDGASDTVDFINSEIDQSCAHLYRVLFQTNEEFACTRGVVVVIDEFHRIRNDQQEKLLKRIEDIDKINFVLMTTHKDKIDPAILDRLGINCFYFNDPSIDDLKEHLCLIANRNNKKLDGDGAVLIAQQCKQKMRSCISAMKELCLTNSETITKSDVEELFGIAETTSDKTGDIDVDFI